MHRGTIVSTQLFFAHEEAAEVARPSSNPDDDQLILHSSIQEIIDRIDLLTRKIDSHVENIDECPQLASLRLGSDELRFYNWLKKTSAARAARSKYFVQDYIVGEPCWDILIDLAISEIENRKISVTSACIAGRIPQTTALRYLLLMEKDGLIERTSDPTDGRRYFLRISKDSFEALYAYCRDMA